MGEDKKAPKPFGATECFDQCRRRLERLPLGARWQVLESLRLMCCPPAGSFKGVEPQDPRQTDIPGAFEDPFAGERK